MLILLDCRPLQYAGPGSEKSRLIFSAAAALAGQKAVKWLLAVDHTYRPEMLPQLPGAGVLTRRAFPGRAGWQLWYDWQIPRMARQQGADLVMLTAGIAAALPAIPQCLWMPERADPAEASTANRYPSFYRGRLADSLQRASAIFCFSTRDRDCLVSRHPPAEEKILILPPAPAEGIAILSMVEKEDIKQGYTGGKEYFLANLDGTGEEGAINLLKAFSLFKKRQLSNMQLFLTGRMRASSAGIRQRLETYKYRQDVHWPAELPESEGLQLAGAAYAHLFPADGDTLGTPLLNAWKAGVPVITVSGGRLAEMADDAALVAGMDDPASMATQLMLIYKDERLRKDLIGKGLDRVGAFSRGRTTETVWDGICKTTGEQIPG